MKQLRFAIIPVLLLLASCSRNDNPAKWILFSKDRNASLYYTFDRMSKTDGHIVKIWVKTVHANGIPDDPNVSYSKNMYMINCPARTYAINPGFNYSSSGEIISKTDSSQTDQTLMPLDRPNREPASTPDNTGSGQFCPLVPDSAAGRLYPVVCR